MLRASSVRLVAAAFFLLAGGLLSPAQAACLTIGIGTGGAYAEKRAAVIEKIFNKAGLCAKPLLAPARRLDLMEKKGELDGNAWRDDDYLASHGSEAKVPTPAEYFRGSLFWLRDRQDPSGQAGATIGILAGRDWPRDALKGLPISIFEANNYTQLVRLTESGRLEGFVMPTALFDTLDLDRALYQSKIIRAVPLYLVVQSRHRELIPALDDAIKALKDSGALDDPALRPPEDHSPASR
jgi:hypothetical protein